MKTHCILDRLPPWDGVPRVHLLPPWDGVSRLSAFVWPDGGDLLPVQSTHGGDAND